MGISALGQASKELLGEISRMAYGSGLLEKTSGGKGNMGVLFDAQGKARVIKFDTHGRSEHQTPSMQILSSNDLRLRILAIACEAKISKKQYDKLCTLLQVSTKSDGSVFRPQSLLSRKIVAQAVTLIGGKAAWDMALNGHDISTYASRKQADMTFDTVNSRKDLGGTPWAGTFKDDLVNRAKEKSELLLARLELKGVDRSKRDTKDVAGVVNLRQAAMKRLGFEGQLRETFKNELLQKLPLKPEFRSLFSSDELYETFGRNTVQELMKQKAQDIEADVSIETLRSDLTAKISSEEFSYNDKELKKALGGLWEQKFMNDVALLSNRAGVTNRHGLLLSGSPFERSRLPVDVLVGRMKELSDARSSARFGLGLAVKLDNLIKDRLEVANPALKDVPNWRSLPLPAGLKKVSENILKRVLEGWMKYLDGSSDGVLDDAAKVDDLNAAVDNELKSQNVSLVLEKLPAARSLKDSALDALNRISAAMQTLSRTVLNSAGTISETKTRGESFNASIETLMKLVNGFEKFSELFDVKDAAEYFKGKPRMGKEDLNWARKYIEEKDKNLTVDELRLRAKIDDEFAKETGSAAHALANTRQSLKAQYEGFLGSLIEAANFLEEKMTTSQETEKILTRFLDALSTGGCLQARASALQETLMQEKNVGSANAKEIKSTYPTLKEALGDAVMNVQSADPDGFDAIDSDTLLVKLSNELGNTSIDDGKNPPMKLTRGWFTKAENKTEVLRILADDLAVIDEKLKI